MNRNIAGIIALLLSIVPATGAWAQTAPANADPWLQSLPALHEVRLESPENVTSVGQLMYPDTWSSRAYRDLTPDAEPASLYYVTFTEGETFRFIFPVEYTWAFQDPIFELGGTNYRDDALIDGRIVPLSINIPNRILRIRAALLAGEDYFNAAATQAGVTFGLVRPELPIDIYIGRFGPAKETAGAYTRFLMQEIRFRDDLPVNRIEPNAVHELFHIVQGESIFNGDVINFRRWSRESNEFAYSLLMDATADWASDEPIRIPAAGGRQGPLDLDSVNNYRCLLGNNPFTVALQDLFTRNRYCSSMFIKFYAEQLAQGSDTGNPEAVLSLYNSIGVSTGGRYQIITGARIIEAIGRSLPADRYPGADWRERWRRFYTDYAITAVIQNAAVTDGSAGGRYGIHDDALANQFFADYIDPLSEFFDDYPRVPDRLYETPAVNDDERAERLASLAQPVGTMLSWAHPYILLDIEHRAYGKAPPRPVFVYARGEDGTNAYALRQTMARYRGHRNRSEGQFTRIDEFTLLDASSDVAEIPEVKTERASEYIWFGFVNAGPDEGFRDMEWSYLAAPRMLRVHFRGTDYRSVRFTGGDAMQRPNREWYNGDRFVFEIRTTGQLHLGEGDRTDIPADERTIGLSLHCGDARAVALVEEDGRRLQVDSQIHPGSEVLPAHYTYTFSGLVDPENTVTGTCQARVEITSLLNLGGGDRQVDQSVDFLLGDPRPRVERVQVSANGAVIYDSQSGEITAATATDGVYDLDLKVWFSTEMDWDAGEVSAGLRPPYGDHPVESVPELSNNIRWRIWRDPGPGSLPRSVLETQVQIPQSTVPNGGFLGFSIAGRSETGEALDAAPEQEGNQPDTRHFALLDIDSFYLATLSIETAVTGRRRYADSYVRITTDFSDIYRPFVAEIRLPEQPWGRAPFEIATTQWRTYSQAVHDGIGQSQQAVAQINEFIARLEAAVASATGQNRTQFEAQLDQLRVALAQQEEISAAYETAAAVIRRNEPDFRRLLRLLNGYRSYGCVRELPAMLMRARFGGMDHSLHSVERGADFQHVVDGEAGATGWEIADPAALAWSTDWMERPSRCPLVDVWYFEADDYRALADYIRSPPDFALPEGFISPDNVAASGTVHYLDGLGATFNDALFGVAHVAWKFAHEAPGSVRFSGPILIPVFPGGRPVLPNLPEGPLVRAIYLPDAAWPFPVHAAGRQTKDYSGPVEAEEEVIEFELTNIDPGNPDELLSSLRYTTNVFGGTVPRSPGFSPRIGDFDIVWDLETGDRHQVTNRTFEGHIHEREFELVIAGPAPGAVLSGGLLGRWRRSQARVDEDHETRVLWRFELNGLGGGDSPWGESTDVAAADPGPPPESSPTTDSPPTTVAPDEDTGGDDAANDANEDAAASDRMSDDRRASTGDSDTGRDDGDAPAPPAPADDGIGGLIVPPTIVQPTIRYAGVLTGAVIDTSANHDPGHVLLYLEGDALPPHNERPVPMDLEDGFRQSFMALPVGGSIRFRNVEEASGVQYEIYSENDIATFEILLQPGDEEVIEFPEEGRINILNMRDPAHRLTLHVIPGTRFNAMNYEGQGYIIRDVPPATYVLRVLAEDRRYQPLTYNVTVRGAGNTILDVELYERGSLAAGLPAD